jgi:hypothetical protein
MPKILVNKPFPFAVDGNHVIQIETGEQEVSDRCAIVAVDHLKFASFAGGEKPKAEMKPKSEKRSQE